MIHGKVLYDKNSKEILYPASTTKIMTAILALENCSLTDIATVSHNAVYSIPYGYSHASLKEGEQLTISDLLNVLLIPSANDAAVVIAEHIADSVDEFSEMMNNKAKEIGCLNTHFVNPNGIHNENHFSTAYDLSLIGKYAMQFDTFKSIVSKTSCSLPTTNMYDKEDRLFNTTNELIRKNYSSAASNYYYPYATGAKTGYTVPAGQCIVATAQKDGVSLLAVILDATNMENGLSERFIDCKSLFEYGFNNFSTQTVFTKGSIAHSLKINNATYETADLDLFYSENVTDLFPSTLDIQSYNPTLTLTQDISAPIAEGTVLGIANLELDGVTYSCNLIASHSVYRSQIVKTIMQILLLIIVLIIFAKFIKFINMGKKSKKRGRNYNTHSSSKKSKSKNFKSSKSKNNYYVNDFYPKHVKRK